MEIKLPKMLKKAPSARKILERSIRDIENGAWICGSWTERCAVKPKGCAMGLVAINAAVTETVRFRNYGGDIIVADITTMTEAEERKKPWPKSARKAAAALAATVKSPVKARRNAAFEDASEDTIVENIVIDYNDSGIKTRAALGWFNRALASLDA